MSSNSVYLPKNVTPSCYSLTLVPDLKSEKPNFQGYVEIEIDVSEATSTIILHSLELTYDQTDDGKPKVTLRSSIGDSVPTCTDVSLDEKEGTAVFTFDQPIECGAFTLCINYQGQINDKLAGFYKSVYTTPDDPDAPKTIAVTQFEATDARRAVPCWDEPSLKATFNVTLIVQPHLCAISNMNVIEESRTTAAQPDQHGLSYPAGLRRYRFATTPRMSTYLLAFVVGEFDYVSRCTKKNVDIRIYTPIGKAHMGDFALDVTERALNFYEQWFDIPYPLPKVDLLAIPDFAAGAMENWGCITYREARLLVGAETSESQKQRAAHTIAHELAHMWFGNLVTMQWWTHLWLNEGFARFMETLCLDNLFPEWSDWTKFTNGVMGAAFRLDALENSHAIEVEVHHPSEIDEIFDTISYCKGASVIRMLFKFVGEVNFQAGIRAYLKQNAYANARTEDLWNCLSEASGKNIQQIMTGWIKRMGFPLLTVERKGQQATICQRRFLSNGKVIDEDPWHVPLAIAYFDSKKVDAANTPIEFDMRVMSESKVSIDVPDGNADVFKLNYNRSGFFRTLYSAEIMESFKPFIRAGQWTAEDRLEILSDLVELALSGVAKVTDFLDLASCYSSETDRAVVSSLVEAMNKILKLHKEQEYADQLKKFIRDLFADLNDKFGWPSDPSVSSDTKTDPMLTTNIVSIMASAEDPHVIQTCLDMLKHFDENSEANPLPPDLRDVILATAVRHGGEAEWNAVFKLYQTTTISEVQTAALTYLGVTKDQELQDITLQLGLGDKVRQSEQIYCFIGLASTESGAKKLWSYFKENGDKITMSGFLLSHTYSAIIRGHSTDADADEIAIHFKQNPLKGAERTIEQALEVVRQKVARLNREVPVLTEYFA